MKTPKIYIKLLLSIILVTVMILSYSTSSYAMESPEFVRIGLNYISAAPSSCQISGNEELALWDFQGTENFYVLSGVKVVSASSLNGVLTVTGSNNEELTCEAGGDVKKVSEMLLNGFSLVSGNYLEYLNSDGTVFDSVVNFDDKAYRGGISFFMNANNTFNVINELSVDEYTYGVINGEMGYSNPIEALKAQAVVARSYALTNLGRHDYSGYDLCDSTHCQVYKGYSNENEKTNMAVNETKNLGIYYENLPVSAFFSKNSGGYTQNVEDVWNEKLGYLRGVKDIYSPVYKWNVQFTFSEIESKLRAAGYNIGNLKSVAIKDKNSSGAVAAMEFTGDNGKATILKEKIRSILGMSLIKSTMFDINEEMNTTIASRGVYVRGFDLSKLMEEKIYVLDDSGEMVELDKENSFVMDGNLSCKLFEIEFEPSEVTGGVVKFDGLGSGHGVGLPQDSAIEMATQGFDFIEILNYFYTDIEIK
ncbi:MAG: SpoIID/LytB domain-containing protein [Peptostreptococcaceae bacterium]|nr:SpoIID/LytB domain-containing protein [Peptostreptococcaceae bacterium]